MSLIDVDPWLRDYEDTIKKRSDYILKKTNQILSGQSLSDFALGHQYFGLHQEEANWVFREWAPNATRVYFVGECTDWAELEDFALTKGPHGQWQLSVPAALIKHGQKYKLRIYWDGGSGWRIPAYASYVVQDEDSLDFSAVVWQPNTAYAWKHLAPAAPTVPLIYEAHVGMSSEKPKVSSYREFMENVLPHIKESGYNTVQLMAIQEHPYYGSFGYHVSNFFAVSSRCGTPDDFKRLVDAAHGLGIRVIIDVVHSHSVKNETEGLSRFDGTEDQYFHAGPKGVHPAWDSRLFDYGKSEVQHFLLSNCRYWLDEYNIDGFRFDGVTSMLYTHHGLEKSFASYADYYKDDVDKDALVYLRLANQLIHELRPDALTIAEEMSGMPGIAGPVKQGGLGFDYRLAMGAPDLWIKTLKEKADEQWNLGELFHTLSSHRPEEKVISYSESHDQALVGDKTLAFRLIDQSMYWHMKKNDKDLIAERGVALLKLIKLLTASLHGGGYLNFMGNEFGHPEWIDFPREGNNWSFQYARRQWSLAADPTLKYDWLAAFDAQMLDTLKDLFDPSQHFVEVNDASRSISFMRNDYLFAFNFSTDVSLTGYQILAPSGSYKVAFSTDDLDFGGQGRVDHETKYLTTGNDTQAYIKVYLPARTAVVFKKQD